MFDYLVEDGLFGKLFLFNRFDGVLAAAGDGSTTSLPFVSKLTDKQRKLLGLDSTNIEYGITASMRTGLA